MQSKFRGVFLSFCSAFLLSMAATPVAFRDPYAIAYDVDEKGGFAIAVGLLAEKIAGRPTPELKLMTR